MPLFRFATLAFLIVPAAMLALPAPGRAQQTLLEVKPAQTAANATAAPVWPVQPAEVADESDDPPASTTAMIELGESKAGDAHFGDIDVTSLDWGQLAATVSPSVEARPRPGSRKGADGGDMTWSSHAQANGASAVSVKQSVSPYWDARAGADMTVARQPNTMAELLEETSSNGGTMPHSSGSAWAAVTTPGAGQFWDKTALEARLDPGQDRTTLATSISKQVPLTSRDSVTLQNGYEVSEQGNAVAPGVAGHAVATYQTDQSAKLEIGETRTTVTAGRSLSSSEDKWLRKVGAEQKLSEGVIVSGSIGETAWGTTTKRVGAGLSTSW